MLEAKYFVFVVESEDDSEDRFEIRRSFRPIVKFFVDKKDAEEWLQRKYHKYDLCPDEFTGRCLAAWKGGYYNKKVKIALFGISTDGQFTMPKEYVVHVE